MATNKFKKEDMEERINLMIPGWEYEILDFEGYKNNMKIKCIQCGEEKTYKNASTIFRKKSPCSCYNHFKTNNDKLQYYSEVFNFRIDYLGNNREHKKITCLDCGTQMSRSLVSILNTPWSCTGCNHYAKGRTQYTKSEAQEKLGEEYELLTFNGVNEKALLRHKKCNFVFTVRCLQDIWKGRNRGCPKCNKSKSVGEQRIEAFLIEKGIDFICQKTFKPSEGSSHYRFDFYIPDQNLAIEYQGEQHYYEKTKFEGLGKIQKRDAIKREYCRNNNIELLEIPYTQLKEINIVLESRFND